MKKLSILLLGLCTLLSTHVMAEDLKLRSTANTCSGCHAASGPALTGVPRLEYLTKQEFTKKMLDMKAGRVNGTVMPQIAKGFSDEQIKALAAYFSSRK